VYVEVLLPLRSTHCVSGWTNIIKAHWCGSGRLPRMGLMCDHHHHRHRRSCTTTHLMQTLEATTSEWRAAEAKVVRLEASLESANKAQVR
jgi:hypothetical protein